MRTTVALDPDVERPIRNAMRERSISFKVALNEAAQSGLSGEKHTRAKKFVQKTYPMREAQEFRWDKAMAVADAMEDEKLMRKLELRKRYFSTPTCISRFHGLKWRNPLA
jgi:hypothetical protein